MINNQPIQEIKSRVDLLALVSEYTTLKRVASTDEGEWAGSCPICGGHDRFRVWPNSNKGAHFWCRDGNGNGCSNRGDCISFIQNVEGLSFMEAVIFLADKIGFSLPEGSIELKTRSVSTKKHTLPISQTRLPYALPPSKEWQQAGRAFVAYAQEYLWSDISNKALEYLYSRGLTDETIRKAGIGYNPKDLHRQPEKWGIVDKSVKAIWLPRGWVFPWEIQGELWRIGIRRPQNDLKSLDDPKIIGPKGYGQGLYSTDGLSVHKPVVMVEGEITALTVYQEAGDLVSVVGTGAYSHARCAQWVNILSRCPVVLLAFDSDGDLGLDGKSATKGEGAAQWWKSQLSNARRWRPTRKDANDMLQAGADVRGWIEAGLYNFGYQVIPAIEREVFYL